MIAPPGLVSRRINAERIVVLGWSRAILLQLAHPLVAAGVYDHSAFRRGGVTAVLRLHHTIRAMLALTFGTEQTRARALDGIRAIHRRVHGTLSTGAGIYPAGSRYSAEDPDLVLWVHATLLESIPLAYSRLVTPLHRDELDGYCAEAAPIAIELGARTDEVPRTMASTRQYLARMYESGAVAVSDQAKELAAAVLAPPFSAIVPPLRTLNRMLAVSTLPDTVRAQYGFAWSDAQERRLQLICGAVRHVRSVTPRPLAIWPEARAIIHTF